MLSAKLAQLSVLPTLSAFQRDTHRHFSLHINIQITEDRKSVV